MSQNRQDYFSKASLKERGWTDAAIAKFLGEEDKKGHNHNNSRSAVRLYLKSRVTTIESTPEFKAWSEKSQKRSESAKKAAQARLLKKAQEEELLIQQVSDFRELVSASTLDIQPLPHKELIQIVVNLWNEQNPSPQRLQPKNVKFNAVIKRLTIDAQQKLSSLISNAKSVFNRYFECLQNNANEKELTKSIYNLYTSMRGFIKFFKKQRELAVLVIPDLEYAEVISNKKHPDSMLTWMSEIIDLIEDDLEMVICDENEGVDLVPLAIHQVFSQHDKDINAFQTELVEIAAQFPLVPKRYEIVSHKFFSELSRFYPALSEEFSELYYAGEINWRSTPDAVQEIGDSETLEQQTSIIRA